jgi:hypothetical protein
LSENTGLNTLENTTTDGFNSSENTAPSENMTSVSRPINSGIVNTTSNTWNTPQATSVRKTTTESIIQDNLSARFTAIPQLEELFPDQNATLPRSTKQNNGMGSFTLKKESSELYSMALFGGTVIFFEQYF